MGGDRLAGRERPAFGDQRPQPPGRLLEEFGVEISDDEAEKIRKVKDAVEYIEKRAKAQ